MNQNDTKLLDTLIDGVMDNEEISNDNKHLQINYDALPTFKKIHADLNRFIYCRGPVGSGKSSGCIMHCFLNAMKQKPEHDLVRRSKYAVLRASYPALKSTVIESWKEWFGSLIKIVYDTPIRGLIKLPHPDGITSIEMNLIFIALDRVEDVNKLQSLQATAAHVNEAAEIEPGVISVLKTRISRYPAKKEVDKNWRFYEEFENRIDSRGKLGAVDPFIIFDYNSVDTEHWLYNLAEEQHPKPPKHNFYHQPSALLMVGKKEGVIYDAAGNEYIRNKDADNYENLDDNYYIDMVAGEDPDFVNVMVMNNYGAVRRGKPVYSSYRDDMHFDEKLIEPIKGSPIIIGMDLGLQPAAAFMQMSLTGTLLLFDEIVTEDCSIIEFCEEYLQPYIINNYSNFPYTIIVDPAADQRAQTDARSAADIIGSAPPQGFGLPYRTALSQNILKRRESVNFFLRRIGGLSIGPKANYARKGFISGYCYEKVRTAQSSRYKETPEKNIYSHIHDAIQYGAMEFSGGRGLRQARVRIANRTDRFKENYQVADDTAGY